MTAATKMAVKIGKMRMRASRAGNSLAVPIMPLIYANFAEAQGSQCEICAENQGNGRHIRVLFTCLTILNLQRACGIRMVLLIHRENR